MRNEEIKALTNEEIEEHIRVEKDRLRNLRFNHAISPLENPMEIRFTKKLIARLKTEQSKRVVQE